ncbi:hypothetical protein [Ornithinibacillus sp. JPR2-1]|uniref:hypothetical protein n=1 Tax=Ornithinibacillus sp. JPR2-1 TaxID=2094019 RepID=UPI0031DE69EB
MKKLLLILMFMMSTMLLLTACSNEELNDNQQDKNETNGDASPGDKSSNGRFSSEVEDQLDLTVGDTGVFHTTLGRYEMTLNSAKLLGTELDGEETLLDELILLEITVKNIGENEILIEEVMESMGVSDKKNGSNYYDGAEDFESIEKFTGTLAPGEEKTGEFITDVYAGDEYYFKKDSGNVGAGSSNQVMWTIKPDEAR